ncbi:unnamed protein product [Trifolium pratense]|uniref:Uncharacterized protein n=1 Tax=Trifolium pratense TaxID=57577 RepID=A0ACB0LGE4_TRIPR|nr:unnamed protein product [Trifolium pratense]
MAMQPYTGASSSSSSSVVSSKKFDVFISFHGKDTRIKFTSHLYVALSKYFRTFIDEKELEKGDEISSALVKAIEEAYVSVVVFSKNYASSKWCLNELVKILECKKDQGQIVIPVFYEVDPSDVGNQRGSYGQAFEKHEQDLRQSKDKLQKWRNALTEAAKLSGWHFQNDRIESNFIKDIVVDVLHRKLPFEVNKKIVGIEKKYEEIELLLNIGSVSGLEVLSDKALIESNQMKMHDLLVEMGREIVKQDSPKYLGQRSRLWDPEEVSYVLKYNMGTEVVEVIYFNISEISEVNLSSDSFKWMINLRYLHITTTTNKGQLIGEKTYTVNFLAGCLIN